MGNVCGGECYNALLGAVLYTRVGIVDTRMPSVHEGNMLHFKDGWFGSQNTFGILVIGIELFVWSLAILSGKARTEVWSRKRVLVGRDDEDGHAYN